MFKRVLGGGFMKHKIPVDLTWYIQGVFITLFIFPFLEAFFVIFDSSP